MLGNGVPRFAFQAFFGLKSTRILTSSSRQNKPDEEDLRDLMSRNMVEKKKNDLQSNSQLTIKKLVGEKREEVVEKVIESFLTEYKELQEAWKSLETKAQGMIQIVGLFTAGAFAYVNEIKETTANGERLLLLTIIIGLVTSVILSIVSLKVRETYSPPIGRYLNEVTKHLLKETNAVTFAAVYQDYLEEQAKRWEIVNEDVRLANDLKANYLWKSQQFLIVSISLVSLLIVYKIFK